MIPKEHKGNDGQVLGFLADANHSLHDDEYDMMMTDENETELTTS